MSAAVSIDVAFHTVTTFKVSIIFKIFYGFRVLYHGGQLLEVLLFLSSISFLILKLIHFYIM